MTFVTYEQYDKARKILAIVALEFKILGEYADAKNEDDYRYTIGKR